jgi:hypothetical protein
MRTELAVGDKIDRTALIQNDKRGYNTELSISRYHVVNR